MRVWTAILLLLLLAVPAMAEAQSLDMRDKHQVRRFTPEILPANIDE